MLSRISGPAIIADGGTATGATVRVGTNDAQEFDIDDVAYVDAANTKLALKSGKHFKADAGASSLDLSLATGPTLLTTGDVTWPAASGKKFILGVPGSSNAPWLSLSTPDTAIDYSLKTDSATFPGDDGTDHADRLYRIGGANLNEDGNLVNPNRAGSQIVLEHEYATGTPRTITGATNASPIVITVASTAGMVSGDQIYISGALGNTAANGHWKAKNLTGTTFELWNWVVGGADTASTGNGAWTSGGVAIDLLTQEMYFAMLQPGSNSQFRPFYAGLNFAGTWKTQANVTATGELTLTAGASSVWSSTAGYLSLDGFTGLYLRKNTAVYADVGVTTANTLTLASAIHLVSVGGAANIDWSPSSGTWKMPTGAGSWSAQNGTSLTLSGGNQALLKVQSASGMWVTDGSGNGFAIGVQNSSTQSSIDKLGTTTDLRFGPRIHIAGGISFDAAWDIATTSARAGLCCVTGIDSAAGAAATNIESTTGAMNFGHVSASARTWNVGDVNAVQTVHLFDNATPVNVITVGGTASQLGFYGVTAAVQGAVGATLTNSVTPGGTTNVVDNVVAADVDITAASLVTTRNAMYQLALKLATIEAKIKLLGAVKT